MKKILLFLLSVSVFVAGKSQVSTIAGSSSQGCSDGTGSAATFGRNYASTCVDPSGNIYVAEYANHIIRKITPAGVVTTLAGSCGATGSTDGTGSAARFLQPIAIISDASGNLYVCEYGNNTIRKITPAGVVTTFAGLAGSPGGTNGTGSAARFSQPWGMAIDGSGNLYVSETAGTIRKITTAGVVSTLAGTYGTYGFADGTGSSAMFYYPWGLDYAPSGHLYVADFINNRIRKIDVSTGQVTTLAGSATAGSVDGTGSSAQFYYPVDVAVAADGNMYVGERFNHAIRKITPSGVVSTFAGSMTTPGFADGSYSSARFYSAEGLTYSPSAGALYVSDANNYRIRKVIVEQNAALDFDGSNDRVSIPHKTYQVGMSELTLEAWVYITGTSGNFRNIIMKGNYGYGMAIDWNNKVGYWSDPSYSNCPKSNNAIPMNKWTHVAVVVRQGISTTFYINGVADGSSTSAGHTTINSGSNDPLFLGYQGTGCNCNYFSGSMDEVHVWNTARSAAQIAAGMNCSLRTASNLIANYDFNNGDPGVTNTGKDTLSDISGNWNKGTLLNFALTGSTSNWATPAIGHEIEITGNAAVIADGDVTPSTADSTDFGVVNFGTVRRYTIKNTGAATLNISSITVTGTNASEFVLSGAPTSVAPNGSAVFYITFNPTVAASTRTATITVSTNDCDESVYDFSIQGQTPSIPGASLHFNGWQNSGGGSNANPSVFDFVQVPDNGTLDLDNNYTIEAWVYLDDNTNNTIIDKGNYRYLFQTHPNGQSGLGLYNPSMGWVYSSGTVPTGTWTHVAVTFDAVARSVSFYLNGNLLSTHSSGNAGPVASPGPDNGVVTIGRQQPSSCVCNNFDGRMDELRIWTRTLCQAEIQAQMNCEIPTTASGLAANYHFNQGLAGGSNGSTSTLTDATGNGNTGTLTNFALSGSTSNWVSPGGVTSGSSCGTYNAPEINVKGNTINILDGDVTPSLADSTSFGGVVSGTRRRFTIENTGTSALSISSITVSGTHASNFTVAAVPTNVAANSSAIFYVVFNASTSGLKTATININNSDCDEAVYNFNVSAELPCSFSSPLATSVATHTSAFAATTPGGWTCYCNASGELLLALKLGGTGAVIPAAGGVELKINATTATWYPHGTGFVGNYNGWAGLSRSWEVYPSVQPSSNVPVRFYVSSSDITALNTTLSANGASPITTVSEMSFYKVTNGAKPAHSAIANLAQSDVKIYSNFTTANGETPFTDSSYGSGKFHAQFSVSSFSGGGGGSGGLGLTPLPVELLSLSADGIDNRYIRVSWVTIRETNTDKFEIQRSEDGRNFTGIGMVNAAGLSETGKSYQFNDFKAVPGKLYYYRLAVRETDGSVSNTRVVTGSLSEVSSGQISFSPNPASSELSVSWPVHTESARMTITTLSGQVVMDREFGNLPPNRVNLSTLNSGLYIIRFETDDKSFSSKLMIQK